MKHFRRAALVIFLALLGSGVIFLIVGYLLPMLFAAIIEVPWVATSLIFVAFVIGLMVIKRRGWSNEGSWLLVGVVLVGTLLDGVGNPIFNALYETLFLESGHRLQATAIVESIGGETHMSSQMSVVDSEGQYVSTPNWFLLALYRALIYFVFYSILLTISGLFPNRRKSDKVVADESLVR